MHETFVGFKDAPGMTLRLSSLFVYNQLSCTTQKCRKENQLNNINERKTKLN